MDESEDVEGEGLDADVLESGHIGGVACGGEDAKALFVEGYGEARAQSAI
jgi:hypothetical protein